jgi:uncharacterized protein (TIGR03435 family)
MIVAFFVGWEAYAQGTDPSPEFEVASVKPSPQPGPNGGRSMGCQGGPGSTDPGLFTCTNHNISNLIGMAFHLYPYQLPSADYGDNAMYEISAKVPPGTTREQFHLMLQNLVIQRFKLLYHYEKKEMQVYDLVVAKGGLKMKESPLDPPAPADGDASDSPPKPVFRGPVLAADGFPTVAPPQRGSSSMSMMRGRARWTSSETTMEQIVSMLAAQIGGPVTDSSRLKGKYDFTLSWMTGNGAAIGSDGDGGPTLVEAIQQQLGLKLEQKKGSVDVFVIDHVEKTPIEN